MLHNCNPPDGQLSANLRQAAIALSEMKNLVQQEIDDLRQEKFELQQRIDDLRRELDWHYCDNDGSPNCKLSRS